MTELLERLAISLRFFPKISYEAFNTIARNTLPVSAQKAIGIASKFNPEEDLPDLSGRTVIVTGGNVGLGKESIKVLAKRGAKVYMASRTEGKALEAIDEIKAEVPSAKLHYLPLDLASLTSVKNAVETFLNKESQLHILLNNAGVMALPPAKTEDGFDIQWETNYVGHYLLTKLLLPTLVSTVERSPAGTVRIVNVASLGHHNAPPSGIDFRDPNAISWNWGRYGQSKLANILHAKALAKRYGEKGIISVSLHPGLIDTNLHDPVMGNNPIIKVLMRYTSRVILLPPKLGAITQIWACGSPELTLADNGNYYHPYTQKTEPSAAGRNEELADKLWDYTEQVLQEKGY